MKKNILWIIFSVIVFFGSNILTGIKVNSLSRRDKQLLKERGDSLQGVYLNLQAFRVLEAKRRLINEKKRDSIVMIMANRLIRTENLLKQKEIEIKNIKGLNSHQLLVYADSLYNTYH